MITSLHRRRLASYALIALVGIATALVLGKDFNWDSLSYHVYAGYSVVEHRLGLDYFAASTQSYLNPYSHVPLYLMLRHGLAPQLVVSLLALFHILNLLIVYEMATLLCRRGSGDIAWPAVWLAVFLAFINPVFFLELGNTFNEISSSVPVLAGWYLLIRQFYAPQARWTVLAGVLIGAGVALKMTNLLYSVTALPLLLCAAGSWRARAQAVAWFAAGGMLGVTLAGGWWAWQMWEKFGNPLFPLLNQFFQSPDFATGALKHYRFIPDSIGGLLLKPFQLALPVRGVHLETAAPDIRYAALLLLLCLFGLKYALRPRWAALRHDPFPPFRSGRALCAVSASLLIAWSLWVASSGNSRYFLPMSGIASVVLASLLFRFSDKWRFLAYGGVTLVLAQTAMTTLSSEHRWTPAGWGKTWFDLDIPAELRQQNNLYLHVNEQPTSFLLPFLPPGSSMINVSGMYVVQPNASTRALMEKYRGHIWVTRRVQTMAAAEPELPDAKAFNFPLVKFGLETDMDSCVKVRMRISSDGSKGEQNRLFLACRTRPLQWTAARWDRYEARKRQSDAVFARLEKLCPHVFQPQGLPSEGDGEQFWRNYSNTDTVLQQYRSGMLKYRNVFTRSADVDVGMVDALEKTLPPRDQICP